MGKMARTFKIPRAEKEPVTADADDVEQMSPSISNGPVNSISRRQLMRMGTGVAAAMYVGSHIAPVMAAGAPDTTVTPGASPAISRMPTAPNIIVLMTDQERHHMHWPAGWTERNLPSLQRLKRNGLYFNRAYTAATQCSPSRALMMSGRFAPTNRVTQTFIWPGLQHKSRVANIASLLKEKAGYEVVWKGKWHLSFAANAAPGNGGKDWRPEDIKVMEERYGWSGWNPPDAGDSMTRWVKDEFGTYDGLATLGGGNPNNDGRYVSGVDPSDKGQTPGVGGESTVDFLKNRAPKLGKPFCLFVSLVNPHDVGVFPGGWKLAGYQHEAFIKMGIDLPPNYSDNLSRKPKVQRATRDSYNKSQPLATQQLLMEYVNFYAYLHTVVDKHITTVLDTLEETGLIDNTIILRLADHGEGGLSHGMREKAYTVYEEMIHVPLIVHNPKLFPEPRETEALYNHLDLLPTILDLAGIADPGSYAIGNSVVPIIKNPAARVQDHLLFSFDDRFYLPLDYPGGHIRGLIEGDWTYAVYFGLDGNGLEYELYDRETDPGQLNNLLYDPATSDAKKEWPRLHRILTDGLIDAGNLPDSFTWPFEPVMPAIHS
jgi:choline-sulfatase